jgi:predicted RNA-binding protein (virulence factor B family)
MINIGKIQKLKVDRRINSGHFLVSEDGSDVLMPDNLGPLHVKLGEELEVFVYTDTKGLPIATTELPFAQVGELALLKVQDIKDFGAFFDWGIDKDLLVPGNEQKIKVRPYEEHLVRVCLEEGTDRIYGSTKLGKFLDPDDIDVKAEDKVDIIPYQRTPLGHKVVINKKFVGMIYSNETFSHIRMGDTYPAFIKKVRTDGLIDVSLQQQGMTNLRDTTYLILELLEETGGKTFLTDKSTPEEIKSMLGVSKKSFKKAVGILYKERKILITDDGIELTKKNTQE